MAGLPGLSVLVVENDALLAMSIQDALTSAGCGRVETEFSSQQVVKKIAEDRFDLATLSLSSSDGPWPEVAQQLNRYKIPFIYISCFEKSHFDDLPDAPWLSKPFADAELLAVAQVALDQAAAAAMVKNSERGTKIGLDHFDA